MGIIWLLFIFIAVVFLAYMMYSGDSENEKVPAPAQAPQQAPPPAGPVYEEVGDESEEAAQKQPPV